ncbi:hypothetical protein PENSTE_c002G09161 [Penicillium steckii]|uniref:Uncharacterized protein n=1 Tax=Penicillium steckii TaxID=303698 RepID=A0A1V6TUM8_9EURO|nr:hypothetical protein PENSTE_c002G09161 [Penicillium steckii]
MSQNNIDQDHDSDMDEEFEDVPITQSNNTSEPTPTPISTGERKWTPSLSLPPQQSPPIPGSQEETQLRGRLSTGIERITYRQMKSEMGMDAPDTHISHRKYESFAELSAEVEHLIDMLWASSSPSIQTEGLITLAGIVEMALPTHPFDGRTTLSLLHKFDSVFVALCTGFHPLTGAPLLEAGAGNSERRPLVTQTQKVRIRSLAETTRLKVFSVVGEDAEGDDDAEGWVLEATKVYDGVLMLLGDSGDM